MDAKAPRLQNAARNPQSTLMKNILKIVGLLALTVFGAKQALEMGDSRKWPSTLGVISSSRIAHSTDTDTDSNGFRRHYDEYEVKVTYSYAVDGMQYQGHRLEIRPTEHRYKKHAERELADYPVGKQVPVYYNPEEPERSVLKR